MHVWHGELDRAASREALRRVLAEYLDVDPTAVELHRGEHGKPALADPVATLRFNLSHSGGIALIALARGREVGVDVERIKPRRSLLHLARRALGPAAAEEIRATAPAERLDAFHRAWTRHEAVAKCHGTGLRAPLPDAPASVVDLELAPGFAAALAVAGEAPPPVKLLDLSSELRHRPSHRRPAPTPR